MHTKVLTMGLMGSLLLGITVARADNNLVGGTTTVSFDSSFVNLLSSVDISPTAIAPSPSLGVFPITANTATVIDHSGGILFSGMNDGSAATLAISDFAINLAAGDVTGDVVADGKSLGSVALFTLEPPTGGATAGLDLTSNSINAINAVFGTDLSPTAVVPVGEATVKGPAVATPEPGTLGLAALAALGLAIAHRRRATPRVAMA